MTVPWREDSSQASRSLWQCMQLARGVNWTTPHAVQRWHISRPSWHPSQKGCVCASALGKGKVIFLAPPNQRTVRGKNTAVSMYKRSEAHTSELQSLMRISYAVFCFKKKHDLLT